jgi:hypothetical protein
MEHFCQQQVNVDMENVQLPSESWQPAAPFRLSRRLHLVAQLTFDPCAANKPLEMIHADVNYSHLEHFW